MRLTTVLCIFLLATTICISSCIQYQTSEEHQASEIESDLLVMDYFSNALEDKDPLVREATLLELVEMGDEAREIMENLVGGSWDNAPYVRGTDMWVLEHFGYSSNVPFYEYSYYPICLGPEEIKKSAKDDKVVKGLINDLTHLEPRERLNAIVLLSESGETALPYVDEILGSFKDEDARVRYWVIEFLRRHTEDISVYIPHMIEILDDPDAAVRANSIKALGEAGPAATEAFDMISMMVKEDDSFDVRGWAAYTARLIDPSGEKSLLVLIAAIDDEEKFTRALVFTALGELGDAAVDATPYLIDALVNDLGHLKYTAAEALGQIGAEAVQALIGVLDNDDPFVSQFAASALADIGPEAAEAVPYLIVMLSNESIEMKISATATLEKIGPAAAPAAPILTEIIDEIIHTSDYFIKEEFKSEDNMEARLVELAVSAIGKIGPDAGGDVVPLLKELLIGRRYDMKVPAAYTLGRLGPLSKDAVGTLIFVLQERSAKIRYHVAEALGLIGPDASSALTRLREIASTDPNGEVRIAAEKAIAKIE